MEFHIVDESTSKKSYVLILSTSLIVGAYVLLPSQVNAQIVGMRNITSEERNVDFTEASVVSESSFIAKASANSKPTPSEIWSAFFFGRQRQKSSSLQFAFTKKTPTPSGSVRDSKSTKTPNLFQPIDDSKSPKISRKIQANDVENKVGVDQKNEIVVSNNEQAGSYESTSLERRQRIEELNQILASRPNNVRNEHENEINRDQYERNVDVPQSERFPSSKIRLASGTERPNKIKSALFQESASKHNQQTRRPTRVESPSATEETTTPEKQLQEVDVLPTRPQALALSPRSFISTDVVRLPPSGSLVEEDGLVSPSNKKTQMRQVPSNTGRIIPKSKSPGRSSEPTVPTSVTPIEQLPEVENSVSSFRVVEPQRRQIVTPVPTTNLEPKPNEVSSKETTKSPTRLLRSNARFIDPREL